MPFDDVLEVGKDRFVFLVEGGKPVVFGKVGVTLGEHHRDGKDGGVFCGRLRVKRPRECFKGC